MPRKRHTVDQIFAKLRKADVELGRGKKVPEFCKLLEVNEATFDLAGDLFGVPSQGRQGSPREATKRKNPGESGVVMFPDGSGGAIEYTWVDAFRTSLCSNSQKIADFLRRFADLDLVA